MKVATLCFNMFGENTYIIWDENTRHCAIIDPGMISSNEENIISKFIEDNRLEPKHLINTHIHIDHVAGNQYIVQKYNLTVKASKEDEFLGARIAAQAEMFGLPIKVDDVVIGDYLQDDDIINIGDSSLKVLHIPGHSPGGLALYCEESSFLISGDSLFHGSIGRTDLPGGDYTTLIESIKHKIFALPADTIVYPGHGPATTIENERRFNPFLS